MELCLLVYLFLLFFFLELSSWNKKTFIIIWFYSYLVLWIYIRIFNILFSREMVHSLCKGFFPWNYNLLRFSTKYWNKNIPFQIMENLNAFKNCSYFSYQMIRSYENFCSNDKYHGYVSIPFKIFPKRSFMF